MKRIIVFGLVLMGYLHGDILKVGDTITPFSLPDQFDTVHQVNSKDYKTIIVAFDKDSAVIMNEYLKAQPTTFLQKNKAIFISDIHTMPSFVTKLFALPKMKNYPYSLLLIYDEKEIFPQEQNALTIISTKENRIENIRYIKDSDEIEKIFN